MGGQLVEAGGEGGDERVRLMCRYADGMQRQDVQICRYADVQMEMHSHAEKGTVH